MKNTKTEEQEKQKQEQNELFKRYQEEFMRNFLVSINPDSQQLYINVIQHNNASLESKSFAEHKKRMFADEAIGKRLEAIIKAENVAYRSKYGFSPVNCGANWIRVCLADINMFYDFVHSTYAEYMNENYSVDELNDYSIITVKRTNFFESGHVDHGTVSQANATITFSNMNGDVVQFDSDWNIMEFEWEDLCEFIRKNNKLIEEEEEQWRDDMDEDFY